MTCRVGRAVYGTIDIILDVVRSGKSICLLGPPGVGKTTMLRECARVSQRGSQARRDRRYVQRDRRRRRRSASRHRSRAAHAGRRSVAAAQRDDRGGREPHAAKSIVIDEIGTEAEAIAARTIAERGVQLIGTAHGQTLENILMNPTLVRSGRRHQRGDALRRGSAPARHAQDRARAQGAADLRRADRDPRPRPPRDPPERRRRRRCAAARLRAAARSAPTHARRERRRRAGSRRPSGSRQGERARWRGGRGGLRPRRRARRRGTRRPHADLPVRRLAQQDRARDRTTCASTPRSRASGTTPTSSSRSRRSSARSRRSSSRSPPRTFRSTRSRRTRRRRSRPRSRTSSTCRRSTPKRSRCAKPRKPIYQVLLDNRADRALTADVVHAAHAASAGRALPPAVAQHGPRAEPPRATVPRAGPTLWDGSFSLTVR